MGAERRFYTEQQKISILQDVYSNPQHGPGEMAKRLGVRLALVSKWKTELKNHPDLKGVSLKSSRGRPSKAKLNIVKTSGKRGRPKKLAKSTVDKKVGAAASLSANRKTTPADGLKKTRGRPKKLVAIKAASAKNKKSMKKPGRPKKSIASSVKSAKSVLAKELQIKSTAKSNKAKAQVMPKQPMQHVQALSYLSDPGNSSEYSSSGIQMSFSVNTRDKKSIKVAIDALKAILASA
jgi:hypothetical protein